MYINYENISSVKMQNKICTLCIDKETRSVVKIIIGYF